MAVWKAAFYSKLSPIYFLPLTRFQIHILNTFSSQKNTGISSFSIQLTRFPLLLKMFLHVMPQNKTAFMYLFVRQSKTGNVPRACSGILDTNTAGVIQKVLSKIMGCCITKLLCMPHPHIESNKNMEL